MSAPLRNQRFTLDVDGELHEVVVDAKGKTVTVDGIEFALDAKGAVVHVDGTAHVGERVRTVRVDTVEAGVGGGAGGAGGAVKVRPPMTGRLESMRVQVGQAVAKGDVLFVLEAMKMQNEVKAPAAGTVKAIHLQAGATLETSQVVLEIAA